ncbi:MAG: hypothetical protein AAF533_06865 [Acidobacteriota bacterium]
MKRVLFAILLGLWASTALSQPVSHDFALPGEEGGVWRRHLISVPLRPDLEDVGNSRGYRSDAVCESLELHDPVSYDFEPDGRIDTADLLCTLWTDFPRLASEAIGGAGIFIVQSIDEDSCLWEPHGIHSNDHFEIWLGEPTRLTEPVEVGFFVSNTQFEASDNLVTLFGEHDPSHVRTFRDASDCNRTLLALPYNTRWTTSWEVFCGEEGVDWLDEDGDGRPDTCTGGLYPGDEPDAGLYSLQRWDSDEGRWIPSVVSQWFGFLLFPTESFDLVRGEAYLLSWSTGRPNDVVIPTE